MASFDHFLITRFNIRTNTENYLGCSDDWMQHRIKLFEKFCLPSVLSQTNQNFKWLILFDKETPDQFKSHISNLISKPNFEVIYLELYSLNHVKEIIEKRRKEDFIITSRLDNDDAIASNFIDSVQNEFKSQEFEYINFVKGFKLELSQQQLFYEYAYNNHYASLIEKFNPDWKSISYGTHLDFSKYGRVKNIYCSPVWLEVIHDKNLLNRISGIRTLNVKLNSKFSLNTELKEENRIEVFIGRLITIKQRVFYLLFDFIPNKLFHN